MTDTSSNIDLIDARVMKESEIKYFHNKLKMKQNDLVKSSLNITDSHANLLLKYYADKEQEIRLSIASDLKRHLLELKAYQEDKCICGSDLRYIKQGSFYGCVNYKYDGNHKNFMAHKQNNWGEPKTFNNPKVIRYLSDIINANGMKGKINTKALLKFYRENGLPDLCEKYDGRSSDILINRLTDVKLVASEFEKICEKRLIPLYEKVLPQLHVKYKLSDNKERVCIIDFVCSNEQEVIIFECKTNPHDIHQYQNDLYLSVIRFINITTRPVKIHNLVQTDDESFKILEQREMWIDNGHYFGYPSCCINSFLNKKPDSERLRINYHTGFTPCADCSKKVIKPRDIEKLIANRVCPTPFPEDNSWGENGGESYIKVHKEECPGYYENRYTSPINVERSVSNV